MTVVTTFSRPEAAAFKAFVNRHAEHDALRFVVNGTDSHAECVLCAGRLYFTAKEEAPA